MLQTRRTTLMTSILRKVFNFLGFSGVILIVYGVLSTLTGSKWQLLEEWIKPVSDILTLIGTLLTAISVYFYKKNSHPPEKFSLYISGPMVVVSCCFAIMLVLKYGSLPPTVINGFALLGITGGLLRIQSSPYEE